MERSTGRAESNPELVAAIRDEVVRAGRITFARFMELALYHPEHGYYRAAAVRPGRAGDFLTAPEAHPIFGHALARQLDEMWHVLGQPAPFIL
ncbi:MAG TPA: SAM-dependent methyltransferase, partial [Nitrolancea sp.]|nr:SAM-dependent methyltransferase [Nitrolancea sp.]